MEGRAPSLTLTATLPFQHDGNGMVACMHGAKSG